MFKAKYFPQCSLFDAKIGFNSSYVWKGIHSALHLLKLGCAKRVGNGAEINVFQDQWIPSIPPSVLQRKSYALSQGNLKVEELMERDTGWWNIEKLRTLFNPRIVSQIFKIVIAPSHEDSWYWLDEKNGLYSVRSGYRKLQLAVTQDTGEGSWNQQFNPFWKCLWKLKIPLKMKLFTWKAFLDILPTYQNLMKKKVLESETCIFCHLCREDATHALLYCRAIYPLCVQFQPLLGEIGPGKSFWEIILEVKNKGNEDELMKFIAMAWGLWYRRNKFIYDNSALQFSFVLSTALSMQAEFKQVQILSRGSREIPMVLSWKPPPEGSLKINVDGAIFEDINKAGIGVVLRDQAGHVLVACSKIEPAVPNPEFIEATTMLRGLQFGLQWGISKILMETDCLFLVKALNTHSDYLTDFAFVLSEIKRLMLYFQDIAFVHVSRQGNNVAHCLAKYARNIDDVIMWWDECPSFVSQAVWLDRHMLVRT